MLAKHDWCEVTLADLADINPQSLGVATPPDFKFQYIDLGSVSRGEIDWSSVQTLHFREAPSRARRLVQAGDVLFGTVRPALQSHAKLNRSFWGTPLVASTGFAVIRARPQDGDHGFLAHYCLSLQASGEARRMEVGSNYPAVNETDVRRFRVLAPPIQEQRQIAAILDTIDDAICKTEQIIAKLKQVKQGLLHDLLTRGIDDNGELRDPARHPEQFKDSPLGQIPKEWELLPLEQCVRRDAAITYGIVQAGPHVPSGVPYVRTGDMSGESLVPDGLLRTSPRIAASYARSRVENGEIVCAIRATVGKVLPVPPELHGANLTQGTARIAPGPAVNPTFLLWTLRSDALQQQFDLSVKGTTFREITLEQLRKLLLPVPSRHEQSRIAAALQGVATREIAEREQLDKLGLLKAGLMEDLLTGRVRTTSLLPAP